MESGSTYKRNHTREMTGKLQLAGKSDQDRSKPAPELIASAQQDLVSYSSNDAEMIATHTVACYEVIRRSCILVVSRD